MMLGMATRLSTVLLAVVCVLASVIAAELGFGAEKVSIIQRKNGYYMINHASKTVTWVPNNGASKTPINNAASHAAIIKKQLRTMGKTLPADLPSDHEKQVRVLSEYAKLYSEEGRKIEETRLGIEDPAAIRNELKKIPPEGEIPDHLVDQVRSYFRNRGLLVENNDWESFFEYHYRQNKGNLPSFSKAISEGPGGSSPGRYLKLEVVLGDVTKWRSGDPAIPTTTFHLASLNQPDGAFLWHPKLAEELQSFFGVNRAMFQYAVFEDDTIRLFGDGITVPRRFSRKPKNEIGVIDFKQIHLESDSSPRVVFQVREQEYNVDATERQFSGKTTEVSWSPKESACGPLLQRLTRR